MGIFTKRMYTMDQVSIHNNEQDCWVVIYNNVYNLTTFIERHPGGKEVLLNAAGKNVTEWFERIHGKGLQKYILQIYKIGTIVN